MEVSEHALLLSTLRQEASSLLSSYLLAYIKYKNTAAISTDDDRTDTKLQSLQLTKPLRTLTDNKVG